jgi:signal transduction histidine kinase
VSIVQPGILLALCTPFALAVWIASQRTSAAARRTTDWSQIIDDADVDLEAARFEAETIDIAAAIREAASWIEALTRAHAIQIDLAVSPSSTVHADPRALDMALRRTMLAAIQAAPEGRLLVTTQMLGRQLHIRVTDDGPGVDQQVREARLRGAEAVIALQGGSIGVDARPGHGTTVTIRLPLPACVGNGASDAARDPIPAELAPCISVSAF